MGYVAQELVFLLFQPWELVVQPADPLPSSTSSAGPSTGR